MIAIMDKRKLDINKIDQKLHDDYRSNRYLEYLPEKDLQDRANDILVNLTAITPNGKISLACKEDNGGYWYSRFNHIIEEFRLRYGPYPVGFTKGFIKNAAIPSLSSPLVNKSCSLVEKLGTDQDRSFFRVGEYKYLKDLIAYGDLRISPASSYNDPSLNAAIQDDELNLTIRPYRKPFPIYQYDPPVSPIPGYIVNEIKSVSDTNYYVMCMSYKYRPRLPIDFKADSVLQISDVIGFSKRIKESVKNELPDWEMGVAMVEYIDPILPMNTRPETLTCKHFKYAYQSEIRFIWRPPEPVAVLDHIHVNLGDVNSFCQLYDLR